MKLRSFDEELMISIEEAGYKNISNFVDIEYSNLAEVQKESKKRMIRRYCRAESVPAYATAKELLSVLRIKATDKEILDSLVKARSIRDLNKNNYYTANFTRHLYIPYSDLLCEGINMGNIERTLFSRVADVTNKNSFNEYVSMLIKNDLQYFTLVKQSDEEQI